MDTDMLHSGGPRSSPRLERTGTCPPKPPTNQHLDYPRVMKKTPALEVKIGLNIGASVEVTVLFVFVLCCRFTMFGLLYLNAVVKSGLKRGNQTEWVNI